MAFRGRGRGRGGFGGFHRAPQEPFELYPTDVELPELPAVNNEAKRLILLNRDLYKYWRFSSYVLEEKTCEKSKSKSSDIERYSEETEKTFSRDSFHAVIQLNKFPRELTEGTRPRSKKKIRWNPESEIKTLDIFEKLELKAQGRGDIDEKDKKEGENTDEEDAEEEEPEDDLSDDYFQNKDFDDDEDDYNMDEGEDEAIM